MRGYPTREEVAGMRPRRRLDRRRSPTPTPTWPSDFRTTRRFRTWRGIGSRDGVTARFTQEEHDALTDAMLAVTPRAPDGTLRIPFGAIYLTARRPSA